MLQIISTTFQIVTKLYYKIIYCFTNKKISFNTIRALVILSFVKTLISKNKALYFFHNHCQLIKYNNYECINFIIPN